MQLVGSDGPTFIEGPLAHDLHYAQMLASVSKRPVMTSASQTGTSVGAAMLIQAPDEPPAYTHVKVDANRRHAMQHYAQLWQKHLKAHAK